MRLKLKKIFRILFFTILILLILEAILGLLYQPFFLSRENEVDPIYWMQKYVHLNKNGYRDRDFTQSKPEDTYRIYTIGDSYTFGWFINDPINTYPKIIESSLQSKTKKKVEVINASQ